MRAACPQHPPGMPLSPVHKDAIRWTGLAKARPLPARRWSSRAPFGLTRPTGVETGLLACMRTLANSRGATAITEADRATDPASSGAYSPARRAQSRADAVPRRLSSRMSQKHRQRCCTCRAELRKEVVIERQVNGDQREVDEHQDICATPQDGRSLVPRNLPKSLDC
jgi:hypothetical protein